MHASPVPVCSPRVPVCSPRVHADGRGKKPLSRFVHFLPLTLTEDFNNDGYIHNYITHSVLAGTTCKQHGEPCEIHGRCRHCIDSHNM